MGDAEPHDVLGALAVDALSVEAHLAGGLHHLAHRPQGGGLAGAVGPQDGGDLPVLDRERQTVQHLGPAVLGFEIAHLQERGHQFSPR